MANLRKILDATDAEIVVSSPWRNVIIDDLDDFFPSQHDRYIETNPVIGITEADAIKAIEMLNSKT